MSRPSISVWRARVSFTEANGQRVTRAFPMYERLWMDENVYAEAANKARNYVTGWRGTSGHIIEAIDLVDGRGWVDVERNPDGGIRPFRAVQIGGAA